MRMTLEASVLETVQQTINNLLPESMRELHLKLRPQPWDQYCRNPPSDEAMELAHIANRMDSLKSLHFSKAPTSFTSSILAAFSRLESIHFESCSLVAATLRSTFAVTTLRQLYIRGFDAFPDSESIDAFCRGMETCSLELFSIRRVSFVPEHAVQVATTVARSKTLVLFEFEAGENSSFSENYCVALSKNDCFCRKITSVLISVATAA